MCEHGSVSARHSYEILPSGGVIETQSRVCEDCGEQIGEVAL